MSLPLVAIVGRPNVGKSSLFNALVRSRVAIVDPTAGVTRDRVSVVLRAGERRCELVDTGGIGIVDKAGLEEDIEQQISIAIEQAALILFVVDVQDGPAVVDVGIAERLRRLAKPVRIVANKADNPMLTAQAGAFYALGLGEPIPVAAATGQGIGELRDLIGELVAQDSEAEENGAIRLAIVGRTNAGKSTLVNRLVGTQRMIVSEVPGTTRDAVDLPFVMGGRSFIAVDTAGMRKKAAVSGSPDFYGQARTERAIRRADVVLLMVDASQEIGRIERSIAQLVQDSAKPVLVVLSKWDLVPKTTTASAYREFLSDRLPMLRRAPVSCISAVDDLQVEETVGLAAELYDQAGQRLNTGELARMVKAAMASRGPPVRGGRTGKIFFSSQIDVHPPTVVLFVNDLLAITQDYLRFLEGYLRDHGPYPEVPIRFLVRERAPQGRGKGQKSSTRGEQR